METMKRQAYMRYPFLMVLLLCWAGQSLAQPQSYREEITVVAPFEPSISEGNKVQMRAITGDTLPIRKTFTYDIQPNILPTPFQPEPLQAARLVGEPLEKRYKNYLLAGFGNYRSPRLEYHYNSLRSKELNYGLNLSHLSSAGKIENYGHPGFSENELAFFLQRIGKKGNTLAARAGIERDVFHYYGFRTDELDPLPEKSDYRQRYLQPGLSLQWYSHTSDLSKLRQDIRLDFSHLSDLNERKEWNIQFGSGVKKNLDVFDFSDLQEISMDAGVQFFAYQKGDSIKDRSALIRLAPAFHTRLNEFELRLGVRADIAADSATNLVLRPLAEVKIHVLESALNIFFGTESGLERNSFHYYYQENPFLSDSLPLGFRDEKFNVYGGVEGRLGKKINFSARVFGAKVEGMPLFVNDTSSPQQASFTAITDEVSIFGVKGSFLYQHSHKWRTRLLLAFHQYSVSQTEAWHLPELTGSFALTYNLRDKLIFETEIFAASERKARIYDAEGGEMIQKLDGYLDLNLKAEYRYSKLLSGFIQLNNLTNKQYQKWNHYPVQGFRLMAGVTYVF